MTYVTLVIDCGQRVAAGEESTNKAAIEASPNGKTARNGFQVTK